MSNGKGKYEQAIDQLLATQHEEFRSTLDSQRVDHPGGEGIDDSDRIKAEPFLLGPEGHRIASQVYRSKVIRVLADKLPVKKPNRSHYESPETPRRIIPGNTPHFDENSISSIPLRSLQPSNREPLKRVALLALIPICFPTKATSVPVVNCNHMDFSWMRRLMKGKDVKPDSFKKTLWNLERTCEETSSFASKTGALVPLLDSPRSIISCLKKGLSVETLIPKSQETYIEEGLLTGCPPYVSEAKYKICEEYRKNALKDAIEIYRYYCATVPRKLIIDWFGSYFRNNLCPDWDETDLDFAQVDDSYIIGDEEAAEIKERPVSHHRMRDLSSIDKIYSTALDVRQRYLTLSEEREMDQMRKAAAEEVIWRERLEAMDHQIRERSEKQRRQMIEKRERAAKIKEEKELLLQEEYNARQAKESERMSRIENQREKQKCEFVEQCGKRTKRIEGAKARQVELLNIRRAQIQEKDKKQQELFEKKRAERDAELEEMQTKSHERELARQAIKKNSEIIEEEKRKEAIRIHEKVTRRVEHFIEHKHDETLTRLEKGAKKSAKRKRVLELCRTNQFEAAKKIVLKTMAVEKKMKQMHEIRDHDTNLRREEEKIKVMEKQRFVEIENMKSQFERLGIVGEVLDREARSSVEKGFLQNHVQLARAKLEHASQHRYYAVEEMNTNHVRNRKNIFFVGFNKPQELAHLKLGRSSPSLSPTGTARVERSASVPLKARELSP